jgi:hypothetical protein
LKEKIINYLPYLFNNNNIINKINLKNNNISNYDSIYTLINKNTSLTEINLLENISIKNDHKIITFLININNNIKYFESNVLYDNKLIYYYLKFNYNILRFSYNKIVKYGVDSIGYDSYDSADYIYLNDDFIESIFKRNKKIHRFDFLFIKNNDLFDIKFFFN